MRHPLFAHVQVLLIALAATTVSVLPAHADLLDDPPEERRPPNIIFILADDLGYGDLSVYGQKRFTTPRLDRMAEEGALFSAFYAGNTVCAPSRWSLMTGAHMGSALVRGNAGASLREEDRTLPKALKQAGYATGMFGKWGLAEIGEDHDLSERYPDVVRRLEALIEEVRTEPEMDVFKNPYE